MVKKLKLVSLFALLLSLISFNAWAFTPPPAPQPPQSYIADVAHKLSATDYSRLNTKIRLINRSSRNEIAILLLPSLDGEAMSDVAHITFNTWKVGKRGLDNGVLILVAVAEHKTRIEVGKGIEGDLTDLQSNEIIRLKMNPHFKTGDFYGGLSDAVDEISKTVESRKDAGAPKPEPVAPKPVAPKPPMSTPSSPSANTSCDVSAAGSNFNGETMLLIGMLLLAFVAYVLWRLISSATRSSDYTYRIPEPRYIPPPPEPRWSPPVSTVGYTPTHGSGVSGSGYPITYVPPSPPVYTPPVEEDGILPAVIGTAVVASLFDRDETPTYSPPSYDPPSSDDYSPSSDSPSSSDDDGFGGGESGGGGSEDSWDD